MSQKSQFAKALTSIIALALFVSGCTKKRDASLPEEQQETVFAISDFGELKTENTQLKIETEDRPLNLSLGESAKATAEKGMVAVTNAEVPERLKFMFKGFEMTGQAGHSYPITLSVDKQFVTAYKIVNDLSQLSILEKQLAQVKDEVVLQKQLQKTKDNVQVKSLVSRLKEVRAQKAAALAKKNATVLVPLFKFKISGYGVLQRTKNELKEETSTLRLKPTDWLEASHVQISVNPADRLPVGLDPATRGDLDRTFVMDRINNKIMTAGTLKDEFQVPLNTADDTKVLTLLDVKALHVFEIAQSDKAQLTSHQLQQLKQGHSASVQACSDEVKKSLPAQEQANCILILRYDVPVKFVRPELPIVDYDGNQDAKINFKEVRSSENVGLVQIEKNVQPEKVESDNLMDPRTMIRISDIKDKEFFFKRTLEDAPVTTAFPPGMAGALTIVKFELEEERILVRKADKLVNFGSGSNDTDYEDIMSIPVKYLKSDTKDASGASYALARLIPATNKDADFVELDWRNNTLSSQYSPYDTLERQCFVSLTESNVSDVDMRMDKGILSFTYNYTAGLSGDCIVPYSISDDYNGTASYQTAARLKERVSFKLNDGTTDVSEVNQIPFRAQNEMGYGVWTIGKINPTAEGLTGREGQEVNLPVVQDFRNGKVLMYTVTGLEPSVKLPTEIRQLYKDTARDVVNAWDLAYHQAFKGTKFERSGRYVDLQFAGENGIEAKVGDLDKNIVHFENKFNDNHGILGVSQVGFNPRSGIIVADSLIVYAGNLQRFVAGSLRGLKNAQSWADKKEQFRQKALAELANQKKNEDEAQKAAAKPSNSNPNSNESSQQKANVAVNFAKQLAKMASGNSENMKALFAKNKMNLNENEVKNAVKQLRALGAGKYEGAFPNGEGAWLDRVLRKVSENSNMDAMELEGLVAKEMLAAKGTKLSLVGKAQLERTARLGQMRSKINAQLKNRPGCMLSSREAVARDFANKTFKEALREELFFDMGHEMGHSQGLTHNFIGSFDKNNFGNEDGSESKRNYSSIMDYIEPGKFHWDGIGKYDIHALRASHLGLLEFNPLANWKAAGLTEKDFDGRFIKIDAIKSVFAKNGWSRFNKFDRVNNISLAEILKPYMYCTDIHVGPTTPLCQRFDAGTSAEEVVENMIQDYEELYVNAYHDWDRNSFGYEGQSRALGGSIRIMFEMRQFMDELFYVWLSGGSQQTINDYVNAAVKAYFFYNGVIRTPDAGADVEFDSEKRFVAVPYTHKEIVDGKQTDKVVSDVAVVEKRAVLNVTGREDRFDTIGIEENKIMAMNFLTMKGFPSYRYYAKSLLFSFMDFEKYVLGMEPEESIIAKTVSDIMLDQLQPAFLDPSGILRLFADGEASVTNSMRTYAGVYGILQLESSTLRDKDNFANLFKVGSSLGQVPGDRVALSQLGVSENSKTRMSYWALDNAIVSDKILKIAASKGFFLKHEAEILPLMENLVIAQFSAVASQGKNAEEVATAKADLITKLNELNANGDIIPAETTKKNPAATIERQVESLVTFNNQIITFAIGIIRNDPSVTARVADMAKSTDQLAKNNAFAALSQKALKSGLEKTGKALSEGNEKLKAFEKLGDSAAKVVDGSQLETSYGIIMKNIEFLNMLTLLTNPEYNR